MQTTTATRTQRLADLLLGDAGPLETFIRERRDETTPKRSWRLVAGDLREATGGEIDLAGETLRLWFPDEPAEPSEAAS